MCCQEKAHLSTCMLLVLPLDKRRIEKGGKVQGYTPVLGELLSAKSACTRLCCFFLEQQISPEEAHPQPVPQPKYPHNLTIKTGNGTYSQVMSKEAVPWCQPNRPEGSLPAATVWPWSVQHGGGMVGFPEAILLPRQTSQYYEESPPMHDITPCSSACWLIAIPQERYIEDAKSQGEVGCSSFACWCSWAGFAVRKE